MMTSEGLIASSASGDSPIFSSTPGRKLSMKICADGTSLRMISIARGSRSDRHRLFLLRE